MRVSVVTVSTEVDEAVLLLILYPAEPEERGSMDSTVVCVARSPPRDWKSDSRKDM